MEIIIFNYKISPYSGNTCWKIQERQDKEGMKAEWREPFYYPSTLEFAFRRVRELVRRSNTKQFKDFDKLMEELKLIDEEFNKKIQELNIQYPGELNN